MIPGAGEGPVLAPIMHNASPRSFARNVFFGYLATFTSMLSGIVVTPVLYRTLGIDDFAIFGLVVGIAGLALLADLGVGTSSVRRIAAAVAVGDKRAVRATVRASRMLLIGSAALSLCALAVVAWRLPEVFGLPARLAHEAQLALAILAVGQSVAIALGTPTMVIIGHGRSDLLAKRSVALGLVVAAFQCVVAGLGGGVVGVCIVIAAGSILTAVIGLVLQRRVIDPAQRNFASVPGEVRDVLREGMANFVISIAGTVAFMSDTIVLGAFAPLTAIAAYTVAAKLPALIRILSSKAIDLLQPTYSHLHSVDDGSAHEALFTVLARATKFSLAAAIALGVGVCVSSGLLLDVWVGDTPANTEAVLYLLMIGTVLQMSGHAMYVLLTGIRRLRRLMVFSIISATVNVGLSIWLTRDLGAPGPALASLICVLIGDVLVLPAIVAPVLGVRPMRVVRELTLVPLLPLAPAALLAVLLQVPTRSSWALLVGVSASTTYLIGFWIVLGRADRAYARGLFSGIHPRLRRGQVTRGAGD